MALERPNRLLLDMLFKDYRILQLFQPKIAHTSSGSAVLYNEGSALAPVNECSKVLSRNERNTTNADNLRTF